MKEQLIDLMKQWGNENNDSFPFESVADYLISNHIIVPPCSIGDTVYLTNNEIVVEGEVWGISLETYLNGIQIYLKCRTLANPTFLISRLLGVSVFLTKEEAEEELKGLHNE